eukprot:scaffold122550_cov21-Tisochrysis_lutea.AAC.1
MPPPRTTAQAVRHHPGLTATRQPNTACVARTDTQSRLTARLRGAVVRLLATDGPRSAHCSTHPSARAPRRSSSAPSAKRVARRRSPRRRGGAVVGAERARCPPPSPPTARSLTSFRPVVSAAASPRLLSQRVSSASRPGWSASRLSRTSATLAG